MDNFRAWFTSYEQNDEEDYCPLFSPPPPLPPPPPPTGAPPQGGGCTITNHHKFDDEDDAPVVAIQQTDPTLFFRRQQQQQQHVLMPDNTTSSGKNKGKNMRRHYKSSAVQGESSTSDEKHKRMMHRDIERQRRQEMASLYASLRFQLPLEYIKGKRSVSDHVMEAAKYIEHKQKSIRELEEKRDKLRSWSKNGDDGGGHVASAAVTVRPCLEGVEILISCGIPKQGFRVSRALHLLGDQQGLQLLSCVCSRVDDTLLHTIRAQVSSHARVDFQELQRNLIYALNS
ncbi:unnamed protein product [Cuscuta campestris]|uniref:BHLH domain-containing protein n=1 Tax=Cuscuta campestris TaxID=132261 RepID=A0A484LVY2_9ASTE|nr:unnamed protein product [Cuscuta campestris]